MCRTKTASKHHDPRIARPAVPLVDYLTHKRNHLICNILKPLFVAPDSPVWITVRIRPGLLIDRIYGKHHHFTGFQPRTPGICHMKIFEIKKPPILTRDKEHRSALVSIDLAFHVPPQGRTVFFSVLYFHLFIPRTKVYS